MANFIQLGRPKSFATTTPVASITDILEMTLKRGSELHKHFGNKRYPRKTVGQDNTELTIKSTDLALAQAFYDGLEVAGVTAIWEGTISSNDIDGAGTPNAGTYKYTCTTMLVDGAVELAPPADGKPSEFSVKLIPCVKEADGVEPVQDLTLTPGGGA